MTTKLKAAQKTHLIYLHGFRSSPSSAKAKQIKAHLIDTQADIEFYAPFLNQAPEAAIAQVQAYIETHANEQLVLVGSSLGGFYATWLAEHYQLPAIVINPAITPWLDLQAYLGKQPLYHGGGEIEIKADYFDQLLRLSVASISLPNRYMLLASTHDEVIDYRTMLAHYPNTHQIVIEQGDHGVSNFSDYLGVVLQFCEKKACSSQTNLPKPYQQSIHNTFGLTCVAHNIHHIHQEQDLPDLLGAHTISANNCVVLGACSNVILPDQLTQPVLLMQIKGRALIEETQTHVLIELAAGEVWHDTVVWCVGQNWVGIENLALIPGTTGAAPVQNIGAYGVELADTIESVKVFDICTQSFYWINRDDCAFSYRHSIFKERPHWVVVSIRLRLAKYDAQTYKPCLAYQDLAQHFAAALAQVTTAQIDAQMVLEAVIKIRQRKLPDPRQTPNVGSFFKNPIVEHETFLTIKHRLPERSYHEPITANQSSYKIFAAKLIEAAGLKGETVGGAAVSTRHALVLINQGAATRADVDQLVDLIQTRVLAQFGVKLYPEPVFIGSN